MNTNELKESLRTTMHFAAVHSAGPMGTMPIVCSVCGLVDVVAKDGFDDRPAQYVAARKLTREHVRANRE